MTFPVTKAKTRDAFGVTFSAPTDPDLTVRFKTNTSNKTLGGSKVVNNLSEIIINDMVPVSIGDDTVNDPVSVRLRVSGSVLSRARVSELLAELASRITTWDGEDVFIGFEPNTLPGSV